MNQWCEDIWTISRQDCIIEIERSPEIGDNLEGFVVGVNERFVLLHALDPNYINLNGYIALRMEDVRRFRMRDESEFFLNRALKLKGIEPVPQPEIDLSDISALLSSANANFPLLTVHLEKLDPTTCFVGRVQKLTSKTLLLEEISPAACWEHTRRYKLKDITRIDFGGAYEAALALVAAHDAQSNCEA